jgi:hypothetical protein
MSMLAMHLSTVAFCTLHHVIDGERIEVSKDSNRRRYTTPFTQPQGQPWRDIPFHAVGGIIVLERDILGHHTPILYDLAIIG